MLRKTPRHVMISQEPPGLARGRSCPRNRIELMIAHDASGGSRIDHSPHKIDGGQLLWPAIDQIAQKDCPAPRMAPGSCALAIPEVLQQRGQPVELAMHVADHINAAAHICSRPNEGTISLRRDTSPPHDSRSKTGTLIAMMVMVTHR